MSIKAKISVDNSQLKKGLQDAQKQAGRSGQQIKNKLQNAGKGFQAVNKLGGKMGGVFKNVAQSIKGLISPIGLAMAGITLAIQGAIKMWDMFTESAEQAQMKAKIFADQTLQEATKASKQADTNSGYFDRLLEINDAIKVSNEMKLEAVQIIQVLTKSYGDLGLSIDKATGKISGLDVAQTKFLQKKSMIKAGQQYAKQLQAKLEVNSALSDLTNGQIVDIERNKNKKGLHGTTFGMEDLTGLEVMGGGVLASPKMKKIIRNGFKQGSGIQEKIHMVKQLLAQTNDKEQIQKLQKLFAALIKYKVQKEKTNILRENNGLTNEERFATTMKLSQEVGKIDIKKQNTNDIQYQKTIQKKALTQFNKNPLDKKARDKAVKQTQQLNKLMEQRRDLLQKEYDEGRKKEDDLLKTIRSMISSTNHQKKLKTDSIYLQRFRSLLERYGKVKDKNGQIDRSLSSLESSILDGQQALYKIKDEPAKKFKQSIKTSAQNDLDVLNKLLGKEKEVLKAQALRNAEKAKGIALTDEQKIKVSNLADLQWDLAKVQMNKLQFGDLGIKTNELTRRGGFASGAYVPQTQDVNVAIKNYAHKQVTLLTDIKNKLNNGGYI